MVNYNKYVKVNKRSIKLAIQEGVRPMTEFFDPSRENLPYFWNSMSPGENFGNWHDKNWSFSHVPGRWLNAIFNAKDVLNVDVDNKVIENLKKWTPPGKLLDFRKTRKVKIAVRSRQIQDF